MRLLLTLWGGLSRSHPVFRTMVGLGLMFLAIVWLYRTNVPLDPFWRATGDDIGWLVLLAGFYHALPGSWLAVTLIRSHRAALRTLADRKAYGRSSDVEASRFGTDARDPKTDRPRFDT